MPMKMMGVRCGRRRRGGRASHEPPRHVDDPHSANMPMKMMNRCGRRRRGGRAGREHPQHEDDAHRAIMPMMMVSRCSRRRQGECTVHVQSRQVDNPEGAQHADDERVSRCGRRRRSGRAGREHPWHVHDPDRPNIPNDVMLCCVIGGSPTLQQHHKLGQRDHVPSNSQVSNNIGQPAHHTTQP